MSWLIPLALAGGYLCIRGFFMEPAALRLEQETVSVWGVPAELAGVRLLHATDLHLRDEPAYETKLLRLVHAARPDVIALTGDYVDKRSGLPVLERVVRQLRQVAPVYASLGDNDLEGRAVQPEQVEEALQKGGARVLRNAGEYCRLPLKTMHHETCSPAYKGSLYLCGMDDIRYPSASLEGALAQRSEGGITILLTHSAEAHTRAAKAQVDVLLAGHTHGGQVCLPWYGALYTNDRLGRPFASGMISKGSMRVHVGRGVGWAKLRVRLFCPPEITLLTLQPECEPPSLTRR